MNKYFSRENAEACIGKQEFPILKSAYSQPIVIAWLSVVNLICHMALGIRDLGLPQEDSIDMQTEMEN